MFVCENPIYKITQIMIYFEQKSEADIMKQKIKKIVSVALAAIMVLGIAPVGELADLFPVAIKAAAETTSGVTEDGLKWTSDGTSVTITGYEVNAGNKPFYGFEFDGHYYGLSTESKSWADAKADCEAKGGYLVSINSAEEQEAVEKLMSVNTNGNRWIGGYKEDGLWQWTDGTVLGYTNWAPGEPNNSASNGCIYSTNNKWDDSNAGSYYYICEWEEEPNEDILFLLNSAIEIPNAIDDIAVTTINSYAFNGCSSIASIIIPDSITSIGGYAFNGTSITEIRIPVSVTSMNEGNYYEDRRWSALCGANELTTVIFEDGRTEIPGYALQGCSQITNVVIPEGVTTIGRYAFRGCTGLAEIDLPDSITTIGRYAFSGCTGLAEIDLPDSITTIGSYAYSSCTGLTEINLPNGVTTINSYAFNGCTYLKTIIVPASLTTAENAFAGSSIETVYFEEGRTTTPYKLFREDTALKNVYLPQSLTSTGNDLFYGCTALESISIPKNVKTLGGWNFYGCTSLSAVSLPDGLESIGEYAFYNCKALASIDIPYSVNNIKYRAFQNCTAFESISLPLNITTMGDNVFNGCTNLKTITIPASLTTAENAFAGSSIETVYFEEGRTTTPYKLFREDTALKNVYLPQSLTSTGNDLFYGCTALESISIPENVKTLGGWDFKGCTSLKTVTLPIGLASIGEQAFANCTALTNIDLPDTLAMISASAFTGCTGLTNIDFPNTLSAIGNSAFNGCSELTALSFSPIDNINVFEYNGHYYALFNDSKSWDEAVAFCEAFGGHLATITSSGENDVIASAIANSGVNGFLLGGNDVETEGAWVWITGEEWTYSNWASGEPNNQGNQDYTWIYSSSGKWDDDSQSKWSAFVCEWESAEDINITYVVREPVFAQCKNATVLTVNSNAFSGCSNLCDVYYEGTEEQWNANTIASGNDPLVNATFHFAHTHVYGEWVIETEATCTATGKMYKQCDCGYKKYETIDKIPHSYEQTVVAPTYTEDGYTLFTCSVCGEMYTDEYIDPLDRIELSECDLSLEYTQAYYEGVALTPSVQISYDGEHFDPAVELTITYQDNDKAGTASVVLEGVNRFKGSVTLHFEISYETLPEQIVNVMAVGEIGKVSLSWAKSSEVNTKIYNVYRKAATDESFALIKTINGRDTLTHTDNDVEKGVVYSYYITGVGIYGEESVPSATVSAKSLFDEQAPTVLKVTPNDQSIINGSITIAATASDNVKVEKVVYYYSADNGESWTLIGEATNAQFSLAFDTAVFTDETIKVKALAYDAAANESDPYINTYTVDNVGPDKVTGLSATALSSKLTLQWNDVQANDAASFSLQVKENGEWKNVATKITTLGYTISSLTPDTEYTYRVCCVDTRGNIGEYSDEFTARTLADDTAPVITAQSPASARYTSSVPFSVTAKDDCDIKSITIQISFDRASWTDISTSEYDTRAASKTYSYSVSLADYEDGSVYLRGVATDFTGNVSDTSADAPYSEYIVDKTAPAAPTSIAVTGMDTYIRLTWSQGPEEDIGKYFVYKSTSLNGNYQLIASNLTVLSYNDTSVTTDKEFFYKLKVSDSCGNMSDFSEAVSSTRTPDTQAPAITGISRTYNQTISAHQHTINISAQDNVKLASVIAEYKINDAEDYTVFAEINGINANKKTISVDIPVEGLFDGDTVTVRAYAVDMAGLTSETEEAAYTFDASAPTVRNAAATIDGTTVTVSWNDNDETDLSGFKVYRSSDGESFTRSKRFGNIYVYRYRFRRGDYDLHI